MHAGNDPMRSAGSPVLHWCAALLRVFAVAYSLDRNRIYVRLFGCPRCVLLRTRCERNFDNEPAIGAQHGGRFDHRLGRSCTVHGWARRDGPGRRIVVDVVNGS